MPVFMSLLSLRLFLVGQFSSAVDATPGASRADKRRAWKAVPIPSSSGTHQNAQHPKNPSSSASSAASSVPSAANRPPAGTSGAVEVPASSSSHQKSLLTQKSAPPSREKKPRPKTAPPVGKVEVPLAPGEAYPRFFKREHWDEPERRTAYRQHEEEQEEGLEPPVGPSAQWDEEPEAYYDATTADDPYQQPERDEEDEQQRAAEPPQLSSASPPQRGEPEFNGPSRYLVRSERDLFRWKLGCIASTALAGGQVLQTSAALEQKFDQLQKRDAGTAEGAGVAPQVRSRVAKASKGPGANANQTQKAAATAAMLAQTAAPAEALHMVTGAHLVHLMTSHPVYSREFTLELRANGIDPADFADGPFLQPEAEIATRTDTNKLRTSSHPSVDVERAKQLWSQHALDGLVRQPPEKFPENRKNPHTAMYGLRVPSSSGERRALFGHRVLCAAWTLLLYVQRDGGGPQPVDWLWNALTQVKTSEVQRRADVAVDTSVRGREITYDNMMRMLKSSVGSGFGSGPGPSASGLGAAQGRGEPAAAGFPPPPQQRAGSSSSAGTNETEGSCPDIAHQRLVDVWASDGDAYYRPFLVRVAAFILFGTGLDPATSSIGAGMNTKTSTSSPTSTKTKTGCNIPEGQGALQKFADARDGIVGLALAQVDFGELFAFIFDNDFSHFFQFLQARGELARGLGKRMRSLFRVVGGANAKVARLEAVGLEYVGGKVGQHRVGAWGAPAASSSGPSRGNVSKKAFATIEEWTEPAGQQAASGASSEAFAPAYVVPAGAAPGIISAMQPRTPGLVYDDRRTEQDWPPPPPPSAAVEMDTAQMLWRARETGALYQEELGIDGRGGGTGIGAEQVAQQPEGCYYGYGAYDGRCAAQAHQTAGGTWHYADPCPPVPLQMSTAPEVGWDGPPTADRESRYNYPQQFSADRLEQMVLDSIRHCGPLYPVAPAQEGPHNPGEQHPVHHQQRDGPALFGADATRRPPVTGEALRNRYTSAGDEYLKGVWDRDRNHPKSAAASAARGCNTRPSPAGAQAQRHLPSQTSRPKTNSRPVAGRPSGHDPYTKSRWWSSDYAGSGTATCNPEPLYHPGPGVARSHEREQHQPGGCFYSNDGYAEAEPEADCSRREFRTHAAAQAGHYGNLQLREAGYHSSTGRECSASASSHAVRVSTEETFDRTVGPSSVPRGEGEAVGSSNPCASSAGSVHHEQSSSIGQAFCMWDIAEAYRSRQGSADAQPMDVDATIDRTADAPPAGQVGPTEAPEARSFMKPPVDPEARIEDYDLVVADVLRRQMESNAIGAGVEVDAKAKLNATDLSYQQGKGNKLHSNSTMHHNATWWAAAQQEQQDVHDSLLLSPATVAALLRENSERTAKSDHVKQQALSAVANFLGRGIVRIPPRTQLRDIVVSQQQTGGGRVASYPESQHVVERVQAFGGFKNGLDTADSDVDVAAFVHLVTGQQRRLVGSTASSCKSKSAQVLNEDQLRHVLFELARWTFPEGENSWRTVHGVFGQWKLRKDGAGQMRARVPVLPLVWRPGPPVRPASGFLADRPWNDAGITTGRTTSSQRHAGASRADAPLAGTSGGMGVGRGAAISGPAAAGSTSPDPNEVLLDVTLNNYDAQQNTELIRSLTTGPSNSLTRDFLLLVKILMKRAGVVGAKEGWLSSHAWALVALHFLQMLRVVPVLSPEAEEPEGDVLEEEQPFSGPAGRGPATLGCRPPDADFKSPSSSCRSGSSASTGAPPPLNPAPASAGYSFLDRSPFSATWSKSVSTSPASRSPTLTAQSPALSAAAVSEDFSLSEFTIVELGEAHQVGEEGAHHLSTWGNPTSAPSPPPGLSVEPPPGLDVQPHTPVQVASQRQPASARHPVPPLVEAALGLAASEGQGKPRSSREGSTSNAAWPFLWLDERPFAGGDWSPPEVHGDPRLRDLSPVALSGITINTLALFNTWEGHAYAKFLSVLLQHFVRYLEKNWEHFSTKGGYVLAVRPPPCTQQVSESSGTGGRGSGGSTSSCSFAFPVWTREAHRARGGQQGQHTSGHLITRDPTAKGNQWISIRDSHSKEEFFWKVDDLFRKLQRDAAINPKKK